MTTSNLQLDTPARGSNVGVWDTPVNSNWQLLDSAAGGVSTIGLTNVNVALSNAQAGSAFIKFTGILTGNVTITFPAWGRSYVLYNQCTGAFTVTATTGAGTSVTVPTNGPIGIWNDGTNINFSDASVIATAATASAAKVGSVVVQTFTGNGTYTPTSGMLYAVIECVGGGGGGGGTTGNAANTHQGGGGGGGSYARSVKTAAQVGASQAITIGTAGSAGSSGANAGGAGGDTSVGALVIGKGGSGGGAGDITTALGGAGGAGGIPGTGDFKFSGYDGHPGLHLVGSLAVSVAAGGGTMFGAGAAPPRPQLGTATSGVSGGGGGYGGGGSGGISVAAGNAAGGAGFTGLVVITEYVA